ncbi:MAG: hypothetical protein Q8K92_07145 [Leadbetterella sp.]|nr:hypothetical protein [Leadbetterella sp.]
MSEIKDYSELTREELLMEQKKIKRQQLYAAGIIGFFIGVIVYGFLRNGFGWVYISISLFMIYLTNKNSMRYKQKLEQIKAEIENKKGV